MNRMPSPVSAGKRKGLESVADPRGIIAALAIDQRSALSKKRKIEKKSKK